MRRLAMLGLVVSLAAPGAIHAQGTLVVSQNKCALDKQGEVHHMIDSLWIPVAQELVNEGKLTAAGSAYHSWGDEWNVVFWYTADDIPTFLKAWGEMVKRTQQRHPTMYAQFAAMCFEHKDSFYSRGRTTAPAQAGSSGS